MDWLRNKVEKLLSTEVRKVNTTLGGREFVTGMGRRPRFITVLMSEHPRWFLVFLFVFGVSFWAISSNFGQLFSRLGAAVALSGILFSSSQIRDIQRQVDTSVYSEILKASAQAADFVADRRDRTHSRVVPGHVPIEIEHALKRFVDELQSKASERMRNYHLVEIIAVTSGTIQWAIGDWITCLFHDYGACRELL